MTSLSSPRSRTGAAVGALLVAGVALYLVAPFGAHDGKKEPAPVAVVLATAVSGSMPVDVRAIGTVKPRNMVTVRARADGTLTALSFQEGDLVRQGQVIARIDPRPYQAVLRRAEAQLARDEATMSNVAVDQERASKLAAIGAGPDQTAKTLTAQLKAAHATLAADQAAVEAARLNLAFTTITAPTSGRIGQRLVGVGSVIRSSDLTGIATITQIDPIDVQFVLSQDKIGEAVKARTNGAAVQILTHDGGTPIATARLDFIDNEVQSSTGQVVAKAQVVSGAAAVWPGELVSVRLVLGDAKGVVVPASAVQGSGDDSYVYAVGKDAKAVIRPVTVVLAGSDRAVLASGIAAGDRVVVDGQSRLKADAKVIEANQAPQAGLAQ